jgi:hypothetical protein
LSTSSHGLGGCHEPDRTRPAGATDQGANPDHHRSGAAGSHQHQTRQGPRRHRAAAPAAILAVLVKQAADQYRAMSDVGPRPQTSGPDPASSSQADPHEVTASQAAQVLGITSSAIGRWTACRAGASCDLVSPFGRQPGDLVWPGEPWRAARLSLFPKVKGAAPRVPRLRLVQHSHLAMFF